MIFINYPRKNTLYLNYFINYYSMKYKLLNYWYLEYIFINILDHFNILNVKHG